MNNEIKNKNNKTRLKIIIGKNKTGKTKYLDIKYNNKQNENVLYIPAEIHYYNDVFKDENYSTKASKDYTPQHKVFDFIKKQIKIIDDEVKLSEEQKKKIDNLKELFSSFNEKEIKNSNDEYFDEDLFYQYIQMKNISDSINIIYDFLEKKTVKDDIIENSSSGSTNYSLIKFLDKFLSIKTDLININNDWTLVIDEIEKFSHPELIFKLSDLIVSISQKN